MTQTCCYCCSLSRIRLCDLMDHSLPGSPAHGMLQAGTPERAAVSSSRLGAQTCVSTAPALTGRCLPLALPRKPGPNLAVSHPSLALNECLWTSEQMWVGSAHLSLPFLIIWFTVGPPSQQRQGRGEMGAVAGTLTHCSITEQLGSFLLSHPPSTKVQPQHPTCDLSFPLSSVL